MRSVFILLAVIIIGLILSSTLLAEAATQGFRNIGKAVKAEDRDAGRALSALPSGVREKIAERLKQAAYEISASPAAKPTGSTAIYHALNKNQQLRVFFAADGIELRPAGRHDAQWHLGMKLAGYGYAGAMQQISASHSSNITAQGNRIAYDHTQLTEWYVNDERGIEQGVVLMTPPAGAGDGNVVIEWTVSGTLTPQLGQQGETIEFTGAGNEQALECSGLKAWDAAGRSLEAQMIVRETNESDSYQIGYAVNTKGAVYPITIDPVYTQVKKLVPAEGKAYDHFGYAVAIDADTVVVGAHWDSSVEFDTGAAYIFSRNQGGTNAWGQVKKLTASDAAAGDEFGISVGISGDTVVVGAYYDDASTSVVDNGAAYIFSRNVPSTNAWGQVKKITASDAGDGDQFGISVGISGDTAVVGANLDDDKGSDSGSAYIFSRNEGGTNAWGQVKKLTASDGEAGDDFGISVGISGDTVVVGADYDDASTTVVDNGAAYIFSRNVPSTNSWGQVKKLTASDGAAYDHFGISAAVSGDIVVVGAEGDDDLGTSSGSAYIFSRNVPSTNSWGQVKKLTASDGTGSEFFGHSVAISGDIVVVGAPFDADKGSKSGSAYIFSRNQGGTNAWGQAEKFTASDGAAGDQFGISVSLSAATVIVGANLDDDKGDGSGAAYAGSITIVQPTTTTTSVRPTTTTTSVRPTTTTTSIRPTTTTSSVRPTTTTTSVRPTTTTSQPTTDIDGDGIADNNDNCLETANGPTLGACLPGSDKAGVTCTSNADCVTGCSSNGWCSKNQEDADGDGEGDVCDNCPNKANGYDAGSCSPWSGSPGVACQSDNDCTASCTGVRACNKNQEDTDSDGVGDVCDNCPSSCNSQQLDADSDGRGDVCDTTPGCGGCSGIGCEQQC